MLFTVAFFICGAIVASFVGVVVARLNTGQSFLHGRSRCDSCNKQLSSLDLVPIISYFISKRRTRCCGARLSPMSPITEFLLGCLFVLAYFSLGLNVSLFFMLVSLSTLLALVLYDLAHQILPPLLLVVFIASSPVTGFLIVPSIAAFSYTLAVAFCIGLFLALIHFFSRGRALGFADAPLAFGLALLTGQSALPGFVFSFWIGAVIGIVLLALRPNGFRMNSEVPFAPFLAAGFLLAYFTQWNPFVFAVLSH
jgi:prepilin signal peptidase PulO-like enzyme (type II secretory pathway)